MFSIIGQKQVVGVVFMFSISHVSKSPPVLVFPLGPIHKNNCCYYDA